MFESLRGHRNSSPLHANAGSIDVLSQFQNADIEARKEIGEAIEQANAVLLRTHRSLNKFFLLSNVDQIHFIGELSARGVACKRTNPWTALGYELYKTWIVAKIEGDQEKIDRFMNAIR